MNNDVKLLRQINALDLMNTNELKQKFFELYKFECSQTNARNIRKRLTYKLQEIYYGGILDEDKAILNSLADTDSIANLKGNSKNISLLMSGTRLHKNWKGKNYEVIVHSPNRYEYEGEFYRSLSAVADKITGTHWNGKKFFGVK